MSIESKKTYPLRGIYLCMYGNMPQYVFLYEKDEGNAEHLMVNLDQVETRKIHFTDETSSCITIGRNGFKYEIVEIRLSRSFQSLIYASSEKTGTCTECSHSSKSSEVTDDLINMVKKDEKTKSSLLRYIGELERHCDKLALQITLLTKEISLLKKIY